MTTKAFGHFEEFDMRLQGWENFEGLKEGHVLDLYYDGIHYGCVVEKMTRHLTESYTASGSLSFVSDAILDTALKVGERVEMRRGQSVIALMTIEGLVSEQTGQPA